jgi:NHL repeat
MVTKTTDIITTVAGYGRYRPRGYSGGGDGDGILATLLQLYYPTSVTLDELGNIYIADSYNHRIRMVTKSTGIINTVAGTARTSLLRGDGGQATSADLRHPTGVALDASGNIYIADAGEDRIRMVTKRTGIISTVAGNGTYRNAGNSGVGGPATSAKLGSPSGVFVDASDNVYIAVSFNSCIRMVTKSTGIITTVVGNGTLGYSGDGGQAISATLRGPAAVAVDRSGSILIADTDNNRIRVCSSV